jgi:hypothetical protein
VLLPGIGGPGSTSIELADLDNDNWLDLLSSHSSVGVRAFFNNGRVPASGSFLLGPWLGFTAGGTFNWVIPLSEEPRPAEDVETADIDGDGDLDFVLACAFAIQTRGSENRLFTNSGSHTFDEITRTDLNPTPFRDDTEDVEFYDLDDDDDYDIVFANVEGPASIHGVDFAYINQGGLQGGTLGSYVVAVSLRPARVTFTVPPADDQSLDAVVADFNGDGFGDVYFCNQGPFPLPPVPQPDTLYLSVLPGSWAAGVPAWTNASALLPDAPGGTVTPSWSVDAETADFDYDPSTVEIVISLGGRCNPREEGGMRMIRATRDPLAPAGLLPFAEVTAVELPPLVQRMSIIPGPAVYVNDIETGDFSGKTHERNFGLATGVDAFLGFTGHVWVAR